MARWLTDPSCPEKCNTLDDSPVGDGQSGVSKDSDLTRSTFSVWPSVLSTVGNYQDTSVLRTDRGQEAEPNWRQLFNKLRVERDIQERKIQTMLEANRLEGLKSPTSSRQSPKVETIELQMDDQPMDLRTDGPSPQIDGHPMEPQIDGQPMEPQIDGQSMEPQMDGQPMEPQICRWTTYGTSD